MGATLEGDRQRCGKTKRRQHVTAGKHAEFLFALIAAQPDLTLKEIVAALAKRGIKSSRSAVWRFLDRRSISYKKNSVRSRAEARGCGPRTPALDARARSV